MPDVYGSVQLTNKVADIFYFLCFTSETTEITENYTQATFSTPNANYFTIKALLYIQRETQ